MKISETTSYPHPVLAPWSSDVSGSSIHTELHLREHDEAQQIDIHCQCKLDHPGIVDLIERGQARFGCSITCRATGFRRLQQFGFPSGTHQFAPGALLERVQLRPMIWAVRPIAAYSPAGAHEEFGVPLDIEPGQILAMDDELIVDVLRPPIPSIESIFEIFASPDLGEAEFEIDLSGDRIHVTMSKNTFELVQRLRGESDLSRRAVMSALYVPVVMEVLHQISNSPEEYAQTRWFEPFRKRAELLDVDLKDPELLTDAQTLLDRPFSGLDQLVDDYAEEEDA